MCLGLTGEKQTLSCAWAHYIWTQRYMLLYVVVGIGLAFFAFRMSLGYECAHYKQVTTKAATALRTAHSCAISMCALNIIIRNMLNTYNVLNGRRNKWLTHTCKPHNRVLINCFALVLLDAIARDVSISELQSLCAIFLLSFRCFVFTLYKTGSKQQQLKCTTINDKLRKLYNNHWNFCKEKIIIIIENAKYTHVEQI